MAGRIAFGPFLLDPDSGRLTENGRVLALPPRPFETLLYLARRPHRVISKKELMEQLWAGTFVTDDVLVQCIVDVRKALGDNARTPLYVETVPRRGYRFIAPATPAAARSPRHPAPETAATPVPAWPSAPPARPRWARVGVAAVVLVTAAGLGWRSLTRQQVTAAALDPGSVVVMPVRVQAPGDDSDWLRQGVAELLRSELGQKPGVHVVARHRLADALAEQGFDADRLPDEARALALARSIGAERAVLGALVRVEGEFALTAQLVHLPSGRSEGDLNARGRYPTGLLDAVDDLARQILERWEPDAAFRPARLSTRSVDAWRHYVEALSWYARGGRRGAEQAERRLDEAVRLDPAFAWAHLKKAEIQGWRRRLGYGDADPGPALREAARLARDLPARERMVVEAAAAVFIERDPAAGERRMRELQQQYPGFADELGIPRLLAELLYAQARWRDLTELAEAHVEKNTLPAAERALLSGIVAKAYRQQGEPRRALDHARRSFRLWPEKDGPSGLRLRTDLARIWLDSGGRDEALAEFRAVARAADADVANLTDAAWGLYMAGEAAEAQQVVTRAIAADASYGNAHHLQGWLLLARGEPATAAASLERAYEKTPSAFGVPHLGFLGGDAAALYYSGVAWVRAGEKARGEAALRRVVALCEAQQADPRATPASRWEARSLLAIARARLGQRAEGPPALPGDEATSLLQGARLAAVQGRRAGALRALARALALIPGERQHVADDPNFESLAADAEFRRLVSRG